MLNLALVVLLAWGGVTALAWYSADRMIFLPQPPSYAAETIGARLVETEDGARIATLHLPNPSARYTLLYSHGNAEDLGDIAPILALLHGAGYSVIAYDYRGYGASSGGAPGVRAAHADLRAVYRHATQTLGIEPSRLVLHGRSVGSGPATALAAAEPVAGLILESAFVSTYRVLTRVPLIPFDRFNNLAQLRKVRCPVLVIHGREDEIIPFWHGQRLFETAATHKQAYWVDGAGHNDLVAVAGREYQRRLREFAESLNPGAQPSQHP